MNEIAGFKRMVMGDYLGSLSYMGSCCGCGVQFMSTHDVVFVPTDDVARANRFRHGPACAGCARKARVISVGDKLRTTRATGNVGAGVDVVVAAVLPNGFLTVRIGSATATVDAGAVACMRDMVVR